MDHTEYKRVPTVEMSFHPTMQLSEFPFCHVDSFIHLPHARSLSHLHPFLIRVDAPLRALKLFFKQMILFYTSVLPPRPAFIYN